jgi:hypothetical protein
LAEVVAWKVTERSKFVWTTRDGRKHPLDEMDDSHVANTIKWIMRQPGEQNISLVKWLRAKKDGFSIGDWVQAFEMELALRFHSYNTHRKPK